MKASDVSVYDKPIYFHPTRTPSSVVRILPRHLRELIGIEEIEAEHKILNSTTAFTSNTLFIHILSQWPLFGSSVYEVSVSRVDHIMLWCWAYYVGMLVPTLIVQQLIFRKNIK